MPAKNSTTKAAASKTTKSAPPLKKVTAGGRQTLSGSGVVHQGRQSPRNGNGDSAKPGNGNTTTSSPKSARTSNLDLAPTSSPPPDWWKGAAMASQMSERDRRRMSAAAHAMGDNYHSLGEFLYRPDLGVGDDADRPTGPRSKVPDSRLYQGPVASAAFDQGAPGQGGKKTAVKSTAKSATKTRSR